MYTKGLTHLEILGCSLAELVRDNIDVSVDMLDIINEILYIWEKKNNEKT